MGTGVVGGDCDGVNTADQRHVQAARLLEAAHDSRDAAARAGASLSAPATVAPPEDAQQACAGPRRLAPRPTTNGHSSVNPAPSPGLQPGAGVASRRRLDAESKAWVDRLGPDSRDRDGAIAALHTLLLKGARFEVNRRWAAFPQLRGDDQDDLAHQSADDALLAVLGKLDEFRGDSRFTTWAYKFAIFEAGAKVRRRAWQGREVPLQPESWALIANGDSTPHQDAEMGELLAALRDAIEDDLTPHQRDVFVAATLNDVPIDVLAERLNATRGALYKTIHDARSKLRAALAARELGIGDRTATATTRPHGARRKASQPSVA
jgi:RNA polymerase sigma-70 factor, ECF subfamily